MNRIFDINNRGQPPGGYPVPDNQVNMKQFYLIENYYFHFEGNKLLCTSFALSKAIVHAFHQRRVVSNESIDIR